VPWERDQQSAFARGYTKAWAKASKAFRVRYPRCGMRPNGVRPVMSHCFDIGQHTPAALVDHVVPHGGDKALFWDEANWQSMCVPCHLWKTAAEKRRREAH
jgi:5-methylcytosine-specific restriction protein A